MTKEIYNELHKLWARCMYYECAEGARWFAETAARNKFNKACDERVRELENELGIKIQLGDYSQEMK